MESLFTHAVQQSSGVLAGVRVLQDIQATFRRSVFMYMSPGPVSSSKSPTAHRVCFPWLGPAHFPPSLTAASLQPGLASCSSLPHFHSSAALSEGRVLSNSELQKCLIVRDAVPP